MANKSYDYRGYHYSRSSSSRDFSGCSTVAVMTPEGENCLMNVYSQDEESFHRSCQKVIDNYHRSRVYDLHSNFDPNKHKEKYINYLEVIIMPGGKVSYAVPSHVAKLEEIACHQLHIDRETLLGMCPREKWLDYNSWLMETTKCIMVWTDFYLGEANEYQLSKLEELKEAGIYTGSLEPGYEPKTINKITNLKRS